MKTWPFLLLLAACTSSPSDENNDTDVIVETDTGSADTDVIDTDRPDTDVVDTDTPDTDVVDTGWVDAAAGFGEITGVCGGVRLLLSDPSPRLLRNEIDFGQVPFDASLLSDGGQIIEDTPNRGGNSVLSEAISFDILFRCEGAALIATEAEINYDDPGGKKTDILVQIELEKVGVSVTRAYQFPPDSTYEVSTALEDLRGKLADALLSNENVHEDDAWSRHVLHVVAYNHQHADAIEAAWAQVLPETRGETLVLLTVSSGDDGFLYNIP